MIGNRIRRVLSVLVVFLGLIAGCDRNPENDLQRLLEDTPPTVFNILPYAESEAVRWHTDVYLAVVEISLGLQKETENGRSLNNSTHFNFLSPEYVDKKLNVICWRGDCYSKEMVLKDESNCFSPIENEDIVFDSQDVLDIALQHSGMKLVGRSRSVVMVLAKPCLSKQLMWQITIFDDSIPEAMALEISAEDGKIIRIHDASLDK